MFFQFIQYYILHTIYYIYKISDILVCWFNEYIQTTIDKVWKTGALGIYETELDLFKKKATKYVKEIYDDILASLLAWEHGYGSRSDMRIVGGT